ncbi:MAG: cell division protein ZapE [Motiliproteus sp.]|jgi:cell division protein ZapE
MTTLQARYDALTLRPDFAADPAQQQAIEALEALSERICTPVRRFQKQQPARGLWLWGPVGRGKTLLMDLFFESLPEANKQRLHFHHFMSRIHQDLNRLAGHKDPLALVASQLAGRIRVLCFDEFFVSDIADAMLLGRLFENLFDQGVFLIATSNQHPDQLYNEGLQRQRFLPAIDAIKRHCQTLQIDGDKDHRRRQLQQADLFLASADPSTDLRLQQHFTALNGTDSAGTAPSSTDPFNQPAELQILGRGIPCKAWSQRSAWFSFDALCEGPRSQLDYIALAERFSHLILSGIPSLCGDGELLWVVQGTEDRLASATNQRRFLGSNDDRTRRFISLIDELYDRSVVLIASAEVGIDQLYPSGPLEFAFARTRSRLWEMQSLQYLQRHSPQKTDRQ